MKCIDDLLVEIDAMPIDLSIMSYDLPEGSTKLIKLSDSTLKVFMALAKYRKLAKTAVTPQEREMNDDVAKFLYALGWMDAKNASRAASGYEAAKGELAIRNGDLYLVPLEDEPDFEVVGMGGAEIPEFIKRAVQNIMSQRDPENMVLPRIKVGQC